MWKIDCYTRFFLFMRIVKINGKFEVTSDQGDIQEAIFQTEEEAREAVRLLESVPSAYYFRVTRRAGGCETIPGAQQYDLSAR